MPYLQIPHFQLNKVQQDELVGHIKTTKEHLQTYYDSRYFRNVRRCRAARDLENYEKDLLPILITDGDNIDNRPNIVMPWIKAVGNSLEGELERAIFTPDFLAWVPMDPSYQHIVEDLTDAFNYVRELSGTDTVESQIINCCVYDGTVPIFMTNTGRYNAVHEIIPTYEAEVTDETRMLLNEGFGYDAYQKMFDIPEPARSMLASSLNLDIGSKIIFKEEVVEAGEDWFTGVRLVSENGFELQRFIDDEESGITSLDQAHQFLQSLGIDIRRIKIINQEVKTTETWVEGYSRPEIKDILRTLIVPPDEESNPDIHKFICCGWMKTQSIIDNPGFINKDKLVNPSDGKPIGQKNINRKPTDYQKKNEDISFTSSEPMVETMTAYFDHFRFKDGTILRNFIATVANDNILVECKPNVYFTQTSFGKESKSPLIVTTFNKVFNENIGTSPAHDLLDLAKAANILANWALDNISRNGGQWAYFSNMVDIKTANGGSNTLIEVDGEEAVQAGINDVRKAYNKIEGSIQDSTAAFQSMGVLKDQMHSVANSAPHPYMQSNSQDTATQASIIANQAGVITGRIAKHIAKSMEDVYTRMLDDLIQRGVKLRKVPYYDNQSRQIKFKYFDFGELRGKCFVPKITSVTPSLNKQVQAAVLEKIVTIMLNNPNPVLHSRVNLSEVIQEYVKNQNLDNPHLLRGDDEAQMELAKIDQKEAIFNAVATGQYILQPNPAAIEAEQGVQQAAVA